MWTCVLLWLSFYVIVAFWTFTVNRPFAHCAATLLFCSFPSVGSGGSHCAHFLERPPARINRKQSCENRTIFSYAIHALSANHLSANWRVCKKSNYPNSSPNSINTTTNRNVNPKPNPNQPTLLTLTVTLIVTILTITIHRGRKIPGSRSNYPSLGTEYIIYRSV